MLLFGGKSLSPSLTAVSCRGMNAMHVLGQYGRENAAALFDLFMECMPEYLIDKPDQNGNTGIAMNLFLSL